MAKAMPTVQEIIGMYWDLKTYYQEWKSQEDEDQKLYDLLYDIATASTPDAFESVRPPTASTIVDMVADHSAGNFPRLHVPRRKETSKAEEETTLMEKAAIGFWYRSLANSPRNILRAWAQSGALRGAICGRLMYNPDLWPDLPLPSKFGGTATQEYKDAKDEADAQRADAWPFVLDYLDPRDVYPDPGTEGREYVIHAFLRRAADVKRAWPQWDYTLPGQTSPVKPYDFVEFISYADDTYICYLVGAQGLVSGSGNVTPLIDNRGGVRKHGYGFLPYFFTSGGFGSPFGRPQHKYRGILTQVKDLIKLEARRMTHIDALIAQQAFPWLIAQHGVSPNMELGGVTRVPQGVSVKDAIIELRPVVPIQEIVLELDTNRAAIQRATIPDTLGGTRPRGVDSGYHESILVGTGRARIRALSDSLERTVEWATTGFFKLVENKVKAPVSVWGKGMDEAQEFVTIGPKDINHHYEVYASLVPSLPQDDSVNIANGLKMYQAGWLPARDALETYAGRENADELLRERMGEDVLKSPQMMAQLVNDAMKVTQVTGGEMAFPGVRAAIGLGGQAGPALNPASNPASNAGVGGAKSLPTPPAAPGSLQEANSVIGRTEAGGAPTTPQGPLQGIGRGRA